MVSSPRTRENLEKHQAEPHHHLSVRLRLAVRHVLRPAAAARVVQPVSESTPR